MFSINSENNAITIGRNNNAQIIMNNTGAIELKNTGISINLTNKTISWVNGNFAVDENGYITAKAGGSIANFNIGNYTLSKNTVGLSSNSNYGYAFWAGDADYNQAPFYIDHTGKIYATKGTIGGWTIDTGEIKNSSGTVHFSSSGYLRGPNWSINSNGHAIFKDIEISSANSSLSATDKILNIGSFYVYKNGYTYIGMDTEFPGIVYNLNTINEDFYYQTMKKNVESTKLIQLGISLTNKDGELPKNFPHTWQFNLKFDIDNDKYSEESINLLKNNK